VKRTQVSSLPDAAIRKCRVGQLHR
jgi:hypothetical protein